MRREKGITMISLIVTIICIVLLSSMAIGTGIRYIRESKERDELGFKTVLSHAVSKRHEETNLNSLTYPYLGYYIDDRSEFEEIILPKVKEDLSYDEGIWYIVDKTAATALGVKNSDSYVHAINDTSDDQITVALVNYADGKIYMISMSTADVGGMDIDSGVVVTGHTHRYLETEPTCTVGVKCEDCGFIVKEPIGHGYSGELAVSEDAGDNKSHYNKVCFRCGMKGGFEAHILDYRPLKDVDGEWYHETACTVCTYVKENAAGETKEACTKQYTLSSDDSKKQAEHIVTCKICRYFEVESHAWGYRSVSESLHEKYCTVGACGYVVTTELHVDTTPDDEFCDLCSGEIIDYAYPQLVTVTMVNRDAETNEEKYRAKYGDTIRINFTADKVVTNVSATVVGRAVEAGNISSDDGKNWVIDFTLQKAYNIASGNVNFMITCESTSGIEVVAPVNATTDGKYVVFDGTAPEITYIDKRDIKD